MKTNTLIAYFLFCIALGMFIGSLEITLTLFETILISLIGAFGFYEIFKIIDKKLYKK